MINERGEFVRDGYEDIPASSGIVKETGAAFTEGEFNELLEREENKRAVYTRLMELVG